VNLNPVGVMALLAGIVLVYSGVKNQYPQDVIRAALGKAPLKGQIQAPLDHSIQKIVPPDQRTANNTPGVPIATV
jgi:hypothetical protein